MYINFCAIGVLEKTIEITTKICNKQMFWWFYEEKRKIEMDLVVGKIRDEIIKLMLFRLFGMAE